MADIVSDLAAKCGISAEQAQKGMGAVLGLLKNNLSPENYAKVSAAVPNAEGLVTAVGDTGQKTQGGVLGAVASAVGSIFGGKDVMSHFTQLGFSPEQLQAFVPRVLDFLKDKVPGDLMKQISGLLPVPQEAAP
jgi:hypothetical protein